MYRINPKTGEILAPHLFEDGTCGAADPNLGDLDALMQAHAVFELDLLDGLRRFPYRREVLPCDDGRLLNEAVRQRAAERIVEDHVPKWNRTARCLHEGRGCQFESDHRLIDRANARRGAIAMRVVHYEDKVVQSGEVIEIALADLFTEAPYARRPPTSDFRIDL